MKTQMSLMPIRCFTCGKVIAHLQESYEELHEEYNQDIKEYAKQIMGFFEKHKIERYCCRRMFLGHPFVKEPDFSHIQSNDTDTLTKNMEKLRL